MTAQNTDVSDLGRTLLDVAWKNGRDKKLTSNDALRLALGALQTLVSACQENNASVLVKLTGQSELPGNFLSFAASLSNAIDLKLQTRMVDNKSASARAWASTSDFDHSVFLALGQALANAAWPHSEKRDVRAPGIARVLQRLAECSARDLQIALVQHYLGNVLQDYFDRAQVRIAVRDLPDDVELEIRRDDCRVVAELAYQNAIESQGNQNPPNPETIQGGLTSAIERIVEDE